MKYGTEISIQAHNIIGMFFDTQYFTVICVNGRHEISQALGDGFSKTYAKKCEKIIIIIIYILIWYCEVSVVYGS